MNIVITHAWGTKICNTMDDALQFIQTCIENNVKFDVEYL